MFPLISVIHVSTSKQEEISDVIRPGTDFYSEQLYDTVSVVKSQKVAGI